ncbi:cytochrome c oxidase assembly protein [Nocardioides convexus]|uniref:cytochrome c oxidase assembly protein n=1 Tax=Nocardioides convexus TaxID=2712224 RepID=UPI003100DB8C
MLLHPVTASLLLIGSLYVVYLGGLFGPLMRGHLGHVGMEPALPAGRDALLRDAAGRAPRAHPAVRRPAGRPARQHALPRVLLDRGDGLGDGHRGQAYYRLVRLPYVPDRLEDQHLAGAMNWALGEVPMVLVVVLLLFQWWRSDDREARRRDRAADRDGDAELAAYNAMLERASRGSRAPRP